jgi:hypothetical protein
VKNNFLPYDLKVISYLLGDVADTKDGDSSHLNQKFKNCTFFEKNKIVWFWVDKV